LGQIEGQNLKVESYGREQNTSGAEAVATEIVRSNPDVIFAAGSNALDFKKLTPKKKPPLMPQRRLFPCESQKGHAHSADGRLTGGKTRRARTGGF
jgi:hypothetical protein